MRAGSKRGVNMPYPASLMTTACATLSFRRDLAGALQDVARLGFTHADLCAIPVFEQLAPERLAKDPDGQAKEIQAALTKTGIKPASFNANVGSFADRTPEAAKKREREWQGLARVMKALGVRTASFYPGALAAGAPWKEPLAAVGATALEMLAAAAKLEVEFVLEPHFDTPIATPEQVRTLLKAVPELRFTYDPSHFVMQDLTFDQTAFILDRAALVHLRDAAPGRMHVRCGQGGVGIPMLMTALRTRTYAGPVIVECLPGPAWDADEDILSVRRLVEAGSAPRPA